MTKYAFVLSKIKNHTCFYDLKRGYVSLFYLSPLDAVFYRYHYYDDNNVLKVTEKIISVRSAVSRVLRNYSSFSFS